MVRSIVRSQPQFTCADIERILQLIRGSLSDGLLTNGPLVREFERSFADATGAAHAVAVSSGTAALEIVLRSVRAEGRQVILPTQTFVASVNSVINADAEPVFAEIEADTFCLDMEDVERRITHRTAAIMLVHMAGRIPPRIAEFQELADRHGIALIEDAAHAHGASFDGRNAGTFGRAGCFSFYPTKVITSAEGGMITTDDPELAEMARSLRTHGMNPRGTDYLYVSTNMRMAEPLAAIGIVQLEHLDEFVAERNRIAEQYTAGLADMEGIRTLPVLPGLHSYWTYLAVLEAEWTDRRSLARVLNERFGIEIAWPYDPPCHLQPVFQRVLGTRRGDLPRSERLLDTHIALPMHCGLDRDDVDYVLDSMRAALKELREQ